MRCDDLSEMGLSLDTLFAASLAARYCAEPVIIPRAPKLYVWSRSEGVMMYVAASRAVYCFIFLVTNSTFLS
jgi:hypothetical protein